MLESFREEKCLSNKFDVWHGHGDRSEELFQVIREFGSTSVSFTRWVHGHKDSSILVDGYISSKELERLLAILDSPLNYLNLLGNS